MHSHYHLQHHDGHELGELIQPVSPDGGAEQTGSQAYGTALPGLFGMHGLSSQSPAGQQQTHATTLYQPVVEGGESRVLDWEKKLANRATITGEMQDRRITSEVWRTFCRIR
jgi:hypothetical protein